MTKVAEITEFGERLTELVKQVQAGHDVVLTHDHIPVARLVPASAPESASDAPLRIRSLTGHQVLTPVIPQTELAEEMFRRQ